VIIVPNNWLNKLAHVELELDVGLFWGGKEKLRADGMLSLRADVFSQGAGEETTISANESQ
jgi:hypothetical protein